MLFLGRRDETKIHDPIGTVRRCSVANNKEHSRVTRFVMANVQENSDSRILWFVVSRLVHDSSRPVRQRIGEQNGKFIDARRKLLVIKSSSNEMQDTPITKRTRIVITRDANDREKDREK